MTNEFALSGPSAGTTPENTAPDALTPEAFASLGGGHIAYMRSIRSEDAMELFPQARLAPGLNLFTLHAADGTPLMLTDSREACIANAMQNELAMLSVH